MHWMNSNNRITLSLLVVMICALVLAGCNPLGLRDSDDQRIQLVADMTDAVENEGWDEVRSYLVPEATDLSHRATQAAVWESVMTTTFSPSEWVIDDYEEWSLVRYPEDAPIGTVVREVDGEWLIDPGLSRLTRGRLTQDISHEYHNHRYEAVSYDVEVLSEGSGPAVARGPNISVDAVVQSEDGVRVALHLRQERGSRATIPLGDIHWDSSESSGSAKVTWTSAPLTEDQSALELLLPENYTGMTYRADILLTEVPQHGDDVTLILPLDEDEVETEIHVSFEPETNPDFSDPAGIPWPIQSRFAGKPFDVLVPTYIPFEYEAPSFQEHGEWAVADYRMPPEDVSVEVAQREAEGEASIDTGETVEITGVGEAYHIDDGDETRLIWVDEEAGVEIRITTGDGDDRQPLEELIRIAEEME